MTGRLRRLRWIMNRAIGKTTIKTKKMLSHFGELPSDGISQIEGIIEEGLRPILGSDLRFL